MRAGKQLLLLAASLLLVACQQKPEVSLVPSLKLIYIGDLLTLNCGDNRANVKWYFNNNIVQQETKHTWRIEGATTQHTGSYECERDGQRSDPFRIDVLDSLPLASLIIQSGQPVMQRRAIVVLKLDNDDGLQGWSCRVCRENVVKKVKLKLKNDSKTLPFESSRLSVPETIYWCTDKEEKIRSNQVVIRTTDKDVALEVYPMPPVVGEGLTLRCLVWGTDRSTRIKTTFYKDNAVIPGHDEQITIPNVAESQKGTYKCDATYKRTATASGSPYEEISDNQELFFQVPPVKVNLVKTSGLTCLCPTCSGNFSYRWYHSNNGQMEIVEEAKEGRMQPQKSGSYACRAMWSNRRSSLSNFMSVRGPESLFPLLVAITLVAIGLLVFAGILFRWYQRRRTTGQLHVDPTNQYEELGMVRAAAEYETIQQESSTKDRAERHYEPLSKRGREDQLYNTLEMGAPAGGEGGYEALKKAGTAADVYHTLKEGAAGGEGGYEALKKEGTAADVYHTLKEGAAGGEGGYEALKKAGTAADVYHTLKEGAAEGEGGYEALKKEGRKEDEYQTLEK